MTNDTPAEEFNYGSFLKSPLCLPVLTFDEGAIVVENGIVISSDVIKTMFACDILQCQWHAGLILSELNT